MTRNQEPGAHRMLRAEWDLRAEQQRIRDAEQASEVEAERIRRLVAADVEAERLRQQVDAEDAERRRRERSAMTDLARQSQGRPAQHSAPAGRVTPIPEFGELPRQQAAYRDAHALPTDLATALLRGDRWTRFPAAVSLWRRHGNRLMIAADWFIGNGSEGDWEVIALLLDHDSIRDAPMWVEQHGGSCVHRRLIIAGHINGIDGRRHNGSALREEIDRVLAARDEWFDNYLLRHPDDDRLPTVAEMNEIADEMNTIVVGQGDRDAYLTRLHDRELDADPDRVLPVRPVFPPRPSRDITVGDGEGNWARQALEFHEAAENFQTAHDEVMVSARQRELTGSRACEAFAWTHHLLWHAWDELPPPMHTAIIFRTGAGDIGVGSRNTPATLNGCLLGGAFRDSQVWYSDASQDSSRVIAWAVIRPGNDPNNNFPVQSQPSADDGNRTRIINLEGRNANNAAT